MVIVELRGGLGNQLFKYAFSRLLALKLNTEFKFDLSFHEKHTSSHHDWYKLGAFNIPQNFSTTEEIKSINPNEWKIMDKHFIPVQHGENVYIQGFWMQNENFFAEIADVIRREVTLKNPLNPNSATWKEKILNADCAVSLHVRMGDYLLSSTRNTNYGQPLPFYYYDLCVNELKKSFPNLTIFVFSDDMQWCKENFKFDFPTEFVEGCEHDFEEMYLMSICKHNINPSSTFSWWGAWLNQNPDKKVFLPSSCGAYIKNHSIIVNLDKNKKPLVEFPPLLSIIVYVGNNLSTINLSLASIFSQNFSDYEVILIDASTDGSGEICRKFASNKNVTLLTVKRTTTKFIAWNKALDVARGYYVSFLTAKDIFFSNNAKILSDVCLKALGKYSLNKENYLTYSTYGKSFYNIICSTKFVEENPNGNCSIDNVPNKKFFLRIDEMFADLNQLSEKNFSTDEKLLALGAHNINNFVGTKFFKRQFINDNKLHFGGGWTLNQFSLSKVF